MDVKQQIKVITEVLTLEGIAFKVIRDSAVCLDQDLHEYNMC